VRRYGPGANHQNNDRQKRRAANNESNCAKQCRYREGANSGGASVSGCIFATLAFRADEQSNAECDAKANRC
jgi:hypothetical protein